MRSLSASLFFTWFVSSVGCTSVEVAGTGGSASGTAASTSVTQVSSSTHASSVGTGGASACVENAIDLDIEFDGGVPDRIYVPVTYKGKAGLFLVDTGSALTFITLGLHDPDYVPDVGVATIGCEDRTVPGRGGLALADDAFGLPVIGTMGVDFLVSGETRLDTASHKLTKTLGVAPADVATWDVLHYDDVEGQIVAPATLDGTSVRLMLDTGSPDVLWLGQQGKSGDIPVQTSDALGNMLTFYLGTTELVMAGEATFEAPVLRAPSFPYFEQTVADLGGNIQGLLGLSAFRNRVLFFDGQGQRILLGPTP